MRAFVGGRRRVGGSCGCVVGDVSIMYRRPMARYSTFYQTKIIFVGKKYRMQ